MGKTCVFCYRTKFEIRIVHEDERTYVVATLGQINEGYVLVIPKTHISCLGEMQQKDLGYFANLVERVCNAEALEYKVRPILFEHGIVGQSIPHAHLHIVPVSVDLTPFVSRDFPACTIEDLCSFEDLGAAYAKNATPYLFWQTPEGTNRICWNPPAPPQYLRIIIANALGRPKSADWRNADPIVDLFLIKENIRRLKPHLT